MLSHFFFSARLSARLFGGFHSQAVPAGSWQGCDLPDPLHSWCGVPAWGAGLWLRWCFHWTDAAAGFSLLQEW